MIATSYVSGNLAPVALVLFAVHSASAIFSLTQIVSVLLMLLQPR